MGNRLVAVCQAFVAQASPLIGASIAYPDPGVINMPGPVWVLHPVNAPMNYQGGSEQRWLDQLRLDVTCSLAAVTPQVLLAIHALPEVVADAFAPGTTSQLVRLGGLVNHCYYTGYEFGTVDKQGHEHFVGRFGFSVKRHRFSGDA